MTIIGIWCGGFIMSIISAVLAALTLEIELPKTNKDIFLTILAAVFWFVYFPGIIIYILNNNSKNGKM